MVKSIIVYKIKCNVDGLFYIGSTTNLIQRIWAHKSNSRIVNNKLYEHVSSCRWKNMDVSILETVDIECECKIKSCECVRKCEQKWIEELKPELNTTRAYVSHTQILEDRHNKREQNRVDELFKCNDCDYVFGSIEHLERHLSNNSCYYVSQTYAPRALTYCILCEKDYKHPSNFEKHNEGKIVKKLHDNIKKGKAVKCNLCQEYIMNRNSLSQHWIDHHNYEHLQKQLLKKCFPSILKISAVERRKEICRKYYLKKEKAEKVECECGGRYENLKNKKERHEKTAKHINFFG